MSASINWDDGRLITLYQGDTATCKNLVKGQLHAIIFYNCAGNDTTANLSVVWKQSEPPQSISVPGTTGNQGLASLFFVNGSDTTTVAVSMLQNNPGAQVQCYIASVKMPLNTCGISNISLPADGMTHPFYKFTRYYMVPASHWYQGQIQSNVNQFISVMFTTDTAKVFIANKGPLDVSKRIISVGSAIQQVTTEASEYQNIAFNLYGNGDQYVWVNADSVQDSYQATICVQSLVNMYESL